MTTVMRQAIDACYEVLTSGDGEDLAGVYSEGTLRDPDVAEALQTYVGEVLRIVRQHAAGVACWQNGAALRVASDIVEKEAEKLLARIVDDPDMLLGLWELVGELEPPGHMFCAAEGDGACFGLWRVEDDED